MSINTLYKPSTFTKYKTTVTLKINILIIIMIIKMFIFGVTVIVLYFVKILSGSRNLQFYPIDVKGVEVNHTCEFLRQDLATPKHMI